MLLGVDVGGTFTDAVLIDGERIHAAKSPTTPGDQSLGVSAVIEAVLATAGADASDIEHFAHGMTVGTNALLEQSGARTALVATDGFTDLLEIARQDRPSLYRPCDDRPPPLSPADLRVGVRERVGAAGTVLELDASEIERVVAELGRLKPESIAICLLFSFLDAGHERAVAEAVRAALPDVHVSTSSEVLPQFREYERCATTVLDAYLSPLLGSYLRRLRDRCAELGLPEPVVMQSSGGVAEAAEAARGGAWSVLSGPAGGAVGAGLIASASGDGDALGFDMGGTSCDVCVIEGGRVRRTDSREFAGRPIQLPMLDVHTVGAGGGSIAWRDAGGALRVGPESAGAEPGPACYGKGGERPTVTDANLLLGYLGTDGGLAGGVELDFEAAERAVGALARKLDLEPAETARGIVEVANQEMIRALRVITIERGIDPRRFSLLPFGGAGPLHAIAIAEELEIGRVLCPRSGGVLSALGLIASGRRRDTARTVMLSGDDLRGERLAAEVAALAESLGAEAGDELETTYELRYRGQAFELAVDATTEPDPDELVEAFAAEHERRYGYREESGTIELVNVRLAARATLAEVELPLAGTDEPRRSSRRISTGADWEDAQVLRGEPCAGHDSRGPCVFELPETTFVVPAGWSASVDGHGTIVAERDPAEER